MSKKKILIIFSISLLLIFGFGYFQINKESNIDLATKSYTFNFNAKDLVDNFLQNEKVTSKKLAGEIIEITGTLKEISLLNDRNTLIISGNKTSGVICDFDNKYKLDIKKIKKNQEITVRGICKGFLKDVILLNCVLIEPKTNE